MKKFAIALIVTYMLVTGCASALTSTEHIALDITNQCRFSADINKGKLHNMHNDNYHDYWDGGQAGKLLVQCPQGKIAQGIMVNFYRDVSDLYIEDEAGNVIAHYDSPYATNWISFDHTVNSFTIRYSSQASSLKISNVHIMSEGVLPDWIQQWSTLEGNAELMMIVTHPDDEILWFGGMLPTYAGQLNKKVIVVYMVGGKNGVRISELLDGLWTMGVRYYPDIGVLPDKTGATLKSAEEYWGGGESILQRVTRAIRRYRPLVVVTQDVDGEYGHLHHIITTRAVIDAVTHYCADAGFDKASAIDYGVYSPKKLYIHLWKENTIQLNWRVPLTKFNGNTGFQVANAAFKKHGSQQNGRYSIADSGKRDCSLFGLYYSSVGLDVRKNDIFENVDPEPTENNET